jgi:hypothetical protein
MSHLLHTRPAAFIYGNTFTGSRARSHLPRRRAPAPHRASGAPAFVFPALKFPRNYTILEGKTNHEGASNLRFADAQREDGTILLLFLCAPYSPLWLKILQIFQRFSGFEE